MDLGFSLIVSFEGFRRKLEMRVYCDGCPLREKKPVLFEPSGRVKVVIVTEGPRTALPEWAYFTVSNPTYRFLYTLLEGHMEGIYWTHVYKCPIEDAERYKDMIVRRCRRYLMDEVSAIKPSLVVAVGAHALRSFNRNASLKRFIFGEESRFRQKSLFGEFKLVAFPHPSGRNTLWNEIMKDLKKVERIESMRRQVIETVRSMTVSNQS